MFLVFLIKIAASEPFQLPPTSEKPVQLFVVYLVVPKVLYFIFFEFTTISSN